MWGGSDYAGASQALNVRAGQQRGILIGKVYGHLSNEHAQRQAQRVNFGPVVLSDAATA